MPSNLQWYNPYVTYDRYHYFMAINSTNLQSNVEMLAEVRRHLRIHHPLLQFNLFQV